MVIDDQLCLPPEPFIKIQRGWLTSLSRVVRRPASYQAKHLRVRYTVRVYMGLTGEPFIKIQHGYPRGY